MNCFIHPFVDKFKPFFRITGIQKVGEPEWGRTEVAWYQSVP